MKIIKKQANLLTFAIGQKQTSKVKSAGKLTKKCKVSTNYVFPILFYISMEKFLPENKESLHGNNIFCLKSVAGIQQE